MKKIILIIVLLFSLGSIAQEVTTDVLQEKDSTATNVVSDAKEVVTDATEAVVGEAKEVVSDAKATVKDVHKNVGETISNATEIVSFTKIFTIAVVLLLTFGFIKLLNWFFKNLVKNFNRHRLKILRIQPVVNILVWTLSVYTLIVTLFNPSRDSIYALMGSSALALGFALQDILKNVFGGLLIILDRPFQIGDRINIKGNYGEVVNIGLRNTQVNTLDDNLVTIPNSAIISDNISNANSGALDCMVVVNLWLPVNVNVSKVRKIANEAAITSRYLNIDKPVTILFFDHFDNQAASKVVVKAYVLDARYEKLFEGDVTEAAKRAFIEAGIY